MRRRRFEDESAALLRSGAVPSPAALPVDAPKHRPLRRTERAVPGPRATEDAFRISKAAAGDRRWMLDRLVETAFLTLGPDRTRGLRSDEVRRRVLEETAGIEGPGGFPNQAFVARDARNWRSGYVWVAEIREEFTGRRQAFILELYVSPRHREKGLGRRLMARAEEWARARGLRRIALSVAEHNHPARALYAALGYEAETRRLGRRI